MKKNNKSQIIIKEKDIEQELLDESLLLFEDEDEDTINNLEKFISFVEDMLPSEILQKFEEKLGSNFLQDIWEERFKKEEIVEDDENDDELLEGCCDVCERKTRLTRHHVFPRETHKSLMSKGYDRQSLSLTIPVCRMCHNRIHSIFTNEQLADSYYTVDLLLEHEEFYKYAKWAALQKSNRSFSRSS